LNVGIVRTTARDEHLLSLLTYSVAESVMISVILDVERYREAFQDK